MDGETTIHARVKGLFRARRRRARGDQPLRAGHPEDRLPFANVTSSPIDVVHLITSLDVGGTEAMLERLISFMDRGRIRNRVICLTDIGIVGREMERRGVPVHALNMPKGRVTWSALVTLWRLLRRYHPHILQTWLYHSDLLGLIVGRAAGVRHVCWNIRCSYMDLDQYNDTTRWTLKLCSMLSSFPSRIVTNSFEARSFHMKLGYRRSGWSVIPNGFDLKRFRPDPAARDFLLGELGLRDQALDAGSTGSTAPLPTDSGKPCLIGFMARYDPMKDHATFIRAAVRLLEKGRDVRFVLAGKGVDSENHALVSRIPLSWRGRFHLFGRRDDIERVTAGLDIASLASHGEGFPNVVCEAMACGVPCVVMDVGDSARIVQNRRLVVPPGDPEALAAAWEYAMDMPRDALQGLRTASRERVAERFDIERIAKIYEKLYECIAFSMPIPES